MIRTILFDLDGTILDTNELIIQSFLHALRDAAPPDFGRETIIPGMGLPLIDQMRRFAGREDVDDLIRAYREYNVREHDALVKPFPHAVDVLSRLHDAGLKLGVVTTKMRDMTERGLKLTGMRGFMDTLVTLDDVRHPKPHPEPVRLALERLSAVPGETIMVGDSAVDMQAAAAAGVMPVGVAWSLKGRQVLRDAGARHIIGDMRELYELTGLERDPS